MISIISSAMTSRAVPVAPLSKYATAARISTLASTTLFAALNILDGTVIGRNMQRHRHQEFIRFLTTIEQQVPVGKVIHAIVENYATHKRIQRCTNGWRGIPAGRSTSPRPQHPG
jgi:hypothetical protein